MRAVGIPTATTCGPSAASRSRLYRGREGSVISAADGHAARPGAPVAVPLAWDQVDEVAPAGVRMHDAPSRLDRAPWSDLEPQDLTEALARVEAALEGAGIALEPFDRFRP